MERGVGGSKTGWWWAEMGGGGWKPVPGVEIGAWWVLVVRNGVPVGARGSKRGVGNGSVSKQGLGGCQWGPGCSKWGTVG